MTLWLQTQNTTWQVENDSWADTMRTSLDETDYDAAMADLIKHGRFLVRQSRCIRARVVERRDTAVAQIGEF